MEINNRFEDIDNDLEIRIHSIENQLDKLLCICTLNDLFNKFNNKGVFRLTNDCILKSQVGNLGAFGGVFSETKSVLFYSPVFNYDANTMDNDMYFLFPKMDLYYSMIPKSKKNKSWEIQLSYVSFENEILYTCGFSKTIDSLFIFRIYTKKSLEPDEFRFNDSIGPRFVLNNKTVYFYGKSGINKGFDLISKKFFQFYILSLPCVFKIHINDTYFIFQSEFNFQFFDKKTTKFLHEIDTSDSNIYTNGYILNYRNWKNSTFLDNYLVKIQSISDNSINLILVSIGGHVQTRILNFRGSSPDDIWLSTVLSVEKDCIWLKRFPYLIKLLF